MGFALYYPPNSSHAEDSLLIVLVLFGKTSVSVLVQSGKQNHFELWRKGFIIGNRPGPLWEALGEWSSRRELEDRRNHPPGSQKPSCQSTVSNTNNATFL